MHVYGRFPDDAVERELSSDASRMSGIELVMAAGGIISVILGITGFVTRRAPFVMALLFLLGGVIAFVGGILHARFRGSKVSDAWIEAFRSRADGKSSMARAMFGRELEDFVGMDIRSFRRNKRGDYVCVEHEHVKRDADGNDKSEYEYTFVLKFPLANGGYGHLPYNTTKWNFVKNPEQLSVEVFYIEGAKGEVRCFAHRDERANHFVVRENMGQLCRVTEA